MTAANKLGGELISVDYSAPVTAAAFFLLDFTSFPSGQPPDFITQNTPTQLGLEFANPVDADTDLSYLDSTPGILTPQTIAY
jgi:hypothetical protein